jgi:hypothetical protein
MIERLFPKEADAWLPLLPEPDEPLDLVWWLSHREPLVLMAARRHTTRAWHSYVVLPRRDPCLKSSTRR